MTRKHWKTAITIVTIVGLAGCSGQNNNSQKGNADRAAHDTEQPPNPARVDPTRRGPASTPEPAGTTTGAGSGSLEAHPRGGASSGTADRNGSTATTPGEGRRPNVDPSVANRNQGNKQTGAQTGREGNSVPEPGQQRKQ